MPGSGKSTVGPLLAERLRVRFADLDTEIEARRGLRVAEIFATEGEAAFRRHEADALSALVEAGGVVVACGGGVVTTPAGRAALGAARCVLLEVDLSVLESRIEAQGTDRPLLAGDLAGRLADLDRARHDLYREVADVSVDAGRTPDEVVTSIVEAIGQPAGGAR